MATVELTTDLRAEYERLYAEAELTEGKHVFVTEAAKTVVDHWSRYETVAASVGCPPHLVAIIHSLESGCNFSTHLHNGDPLTARTVHEPIGRPVAGDPPFTWEASAMDALRSHKIDKWSDWSIPGLLYVLERYNGWGYRKYHPTTKSPYLWSFTSIYTSGKYVADNKWSSTAVSQQVGAVALLMGLAHAGHPYLVQEVADHAPMATGSVSAPVQPAAPVLPAARLPDAPTKGQEMGGAVRADLPARARLIAILNGLSKSKTVYGVLGLLGMQLLGAQTWDVAIRVGGQIYAVPDLAPYVSTALAALATWGRITAKPIGGKPDA